MDESPADIIITSPDYGMSRDQAVAEAQRAAGIMHWRLQGVRRAEGRGWGGPIQRVVLVPSSEVLTHAHLRDCADRLSRYGRQAGMRLFLIDLCNPDAGPLDRAAFGGSTMLQAMSILNDHVRFIPATHSLIAEIVSGAVPVP
jgi:hypothetical protein